MTSLEGWGSAIELRPRAPARDLFRTGEHRQGTGNRAVQPNRHLVGQEADGEWPGRDRQRDSKACGAVGYGSAQRDVAQLG